MRYVALGDSYTIGTGIDPDQGWPSQLVARVSQLELVANLGVNGFSSGDVIAFALPDLDALGPEFVTLLIGVNDVVRGIPAASYAANVDRIIEFLLARLTPARIVTVATPDYTVTPMGRSFGDPFARRAEVERVNAILRDRSAGLGIAFVPDPFPISQAAAGDRGLLAGDGLHPSASQYARWVDAIEPAVTAQLSRTAPA